LLRDSDVYLALRIGLPRFQRRLRQRSPRLCFGA
jgi:hypothetical protein